MRGDPVPQNFTDGSVPGGTSTHAREEEEEPCVERKKRRHTGLGLVAAWESSATADAQATSDLAVA
jgi:hypothetical protein